MTKETITGALKIVIRQWRRMPFFKNRLTAPQVGYEWLRNMNQMLFSLFPSEHNQDQDSSLLPPLIPLGSTSSSILSG